MKTKIIPFIVEFESLRLKNHGKWQSGWTGCYTYYGMGLGEKGVGWLTKLFNDIIRSEKLSTEYYSVV